MEILKLDTYQSETAEHQFFHSSGSFELYRGFPLACRTAVIVVGVNPKRAQIIWPHFGAIDPERQGIAGFQSQGAQFRTVQPPGRFPLRSQPKPVDAVMQTWR
jgi:hypothetical protein